MQLNIEGAPRDPAALGQWLDEKIQEMVTFINALAEYRLDVLSQAPERPRQGLYFADGDGWDPGTGRGLYVYDEQTATYTKL